MEDKCERSSISRRTALFAAAAAAPVLALMSSPAQAKMAQAAVKYQPDPKEGHQCDGCNFFVEPNACKLVDGDISPKGWCALWAAKKSG